MELAKNTFDVCLMASTDGVWEQQWSYVLSNFKPRNLYVIGEVDSRIIPFRNTINIKIADELPNIPLIVLSPKAARYVIGETSLLDFSHPSECIYLFGSDATILSTDQLGNRIPNEVVYIPTDTTDTMYSFMAGAVTLYDRMATIGKSDYR